MHPPRVGAVASKEQMSALPDWYHRRTSVKGFFQSTTQEPPDGPPGRIEDSSPLRPAGARLRQTQLE